MHFYDIDANYPPEVWSSHWQNSQTRSIAVESYFCTQDHQKIPVSLTFTYFEFADSGYNFVFAQDISARLWATQSLRDNENLLRQVFSSISDHIYVTEFTPEGQRSNIYMSPTESLTGYSVDRFLEDWSFWSSTLIHPDDRAQANDQAERLAGGKDSEVEYRLVRADDTVIWVRDSGRIEKDPITGKIIVYGVVSDITERKHAAEAEAQRAHINAFSAEVGLALTQGDDLSVMMQTIAQAMVNYLDAALARIWVFNMPENLLELQASAGLYTHLNGSHSRIPVNEKKICLASTVGEPFVTNKVWDDPRVDQKDWLEQEDIVSLISYPLVVEQQLMGVVAIFGKRPFEENIVEAMDTVANTIALSIDRKKAEMELANLFEKQKQTEKSLRKVNQQMHQRVEELAALNFITQTVATVTDFQIQLNMIAQEITNLFDAFSTSISLINEARTERTIVALYQVRDTDKTNLIGRVKPFKTDQIYLDYISEGKSIIIPEPQTNPLITTSRQSIIERNLQCLMLIPLRARGEVVGTIAISTDQLGREFAPAEMKLAETVAGQLAGAIENARLFSAMQQEIVERKQAQEALAITRDQALEASRFKSQLLAKVSHELRTPLGIILGFAEMLEEGVYGDISERQQRAIAQILESSQYLTTLVGELLDQAQLESGRLQLKISAFDPTEIVVRVETSMRILAQNKGIELTTQIDPNLPTTLSGDPDRIQQIMVNLVSNAIKFTEQGRVEMQLHLSNDTYWKLRILDTGPGIPPEIQATVFEPFQQVDGSITRKHRGYGLGLSIVKQLTELMGGQIRLDSEIGKGSTFTVELPLEP